MKKRTIRLLAVAIMMATLLAFPAYKLSAVTEGTVVLGNVLGSGVTTLVRGLLQGKVHSFKDVVKMLAYGSASGYGFYQSKKLIAADTRLRRRPAGQPVGLGDRQRDVGRGAALLSSASPCRWCASRSPRRWRRQNRSLLRFTVSPRDAISLALSLQQVGPRLAAQRHAGLRGRHAVVRETFAAGPTASSRPCSAARPTRSTGMRWCTWCRACS